MVSTLTPEDLAKPPMVRFFRFSIRLTPYSTTEVRLNHQEVCWKGDLDARTAEWTRRSFRWRSGSHSRLDLLPGTFGLGRFGYQWRLDRQPDEAGALPPNLHRRGPGCTVLCLAAHLPPSGCLQAR